MRYTDLINEDDTGVNQYQQMMNFLSRNKTPGVPPEQQLPLAMFRELQKAQQHNQQLDAELAAAERRIDTATQGGELTRQELGKHQNQLDKERGDLDAQREKMGQIDKQHSEREKASAEQLAQLTNQLEQVKQMPGVDGKGAKELEKQIGELKKNGVDKEKYAEIEAAVGRMQSMQQVDDKMLKGLIAQVKDAQAKADELVKTRAQVGGEIEQTSAELQDEIDELKQQLAHFKDVERTVSTLQTGVEQVIAPKVDKLYKRQLAADNIDPATIAQNFAAKGGLGSATQAMLDKTAPPEQMSLPGMQANQPMSTTKQMALPLPAVQNTPAQPPTPNYDKDRAAARARALTDKVTSSLRSPAPGMNEDKMLKAIKWATGKNK